jgi:hypothetical protein
MLDKIPHDVVSVILSKLGMKSYIGVTLVCKDLYDYLYPQLPKKFPIFCNGKKKGRRKEREVSDLGQTNKRLSRTKTRYFCV